jgi:Divergent polysaccharide deacetylase
VTIAIDPTLPDARARADMYRAAGFEIALLASTLTDAATASDLEVMYQGYREALPDAALFLGTETAPFQSNRQSAEHLVAMLKPEGMGLVSYAKGLNPASGIAAEENLPHAEIWRVLDEGGERSEAIRRALDRAAFEAVQTGQVVVMASSLPETVTAIFGWAAEGAKGVALAPVSAVALKAVGEAAPAAEPVPTP